MTRGEFLDTLRSKLMGEVSVAELENTIRYYDEYITDGVKGGKSEERVLEELGSPFLIAKTIIDTAGKDSDGAESVYSYASNEESRREPEPRFRRYELNTWTSKAVIAVVIIGVLLLVLTILRVLIPIVLPIVIILLIINLFRNGGGK